MRIWQRVVFSLEVGRLAASWADLPRSQKPTKVFSALCITSYITVSGKRPKCGIVSSARGAYSVQPVCIICWSICLCVTIASSSNTRPPPTKSASMSWWTRNRRICETILSADTVRHSMERGQWSDRHEPLFKYSDPNAIDRVSLSFCGILTAIYLDANGFITIRTPQIESDPANSTTTPKTKWIHCGCGRMSVDWLMTLWMWMRAKRKLWKCGICMCSPITMWAMDKWAQPSCHSCRITANGFWRGICIAIVWCTFPIWAIIGW